MTAVDPVDNGFVASLNRPGGNATGLSLLSTELIGKRLSLLSELVPKVKTIGYLSGPTMSPVFGDWRARTIAAAQALGRDIIVQVVEPNRDFETAFAMFVERQVSGITVGDFTFFSERRNLDAIVALAARHRIPAIYASRLYTVNGGLMSYGADTSNNLYQLAMQYVGPMLKGTKPADLPVQQPTKFRLVINLKTANAMALDVPRVLLAAADEVID
jgi:putative tryptophan/tyrosine transport system substrate-binding protein